MRKSTFVQNSHIVSHHHHHHHYYYKKQQQQQQQQQQNWQQQQQQRHHHYHHHHHHHTTTNTFFKMSSLIHLVESEKNNNDNMTSETTTIQGIIFDLDGTLVDTEVLSDKALLLSINGLCNDIIIQQCNYRLPWELKQQILGLRGNEWGPIVLHYAVQHWNIIVEYDEDNTTNSTTTTNKVIKQSIITKLITDWENNLSKLCQIGVQLCVGANELIQSIINNYPTIPMAIATSSRFNSYITKRTCIEQQQQQNQQQNQNQQRCSSGNDDNDDNSTSNTTKSIFDYISIIVCGDNSNVQNGKPAPDIYVEASKQLNVPIENCLVFEDAVSGVQSAIAAGCTNIVAIPDTRYTTQEKESIFIVQQRQQKVINTVILTTLLDFNGTIFGLSKINMLSSSVNRKIKTNVHIRKK